MPLEITLTMNATDLLVGQDAGCGVKLTNAGPASATIADPQFAEPAFRVTNVATAEAVVYQPTPGGAVPLPGRELAPGDSADMVVALLAVAKLDSPGSYDVSAIVEYDNGRSVAESAPVRVIVRPVSVLNLNLAGVHASVIDSAWVDRASDEPRLIFARVAIGPNGRTEDLEPLLAVPDGISPILSRQPVGELLDARWIAWLDEQTLSVVLHTPGQVSKPATYKVKGDAPTILEPLVYLPPASRDGERTGAALIWANSSEATSTIEVIHLASQGGRVSIKGGAVGEMRGPVPRWAMHHALSGRRRVITFIRHLPGKTTLHRSPWPGEVTAIDTVRELTEIEGEFVDASATLGHDDVIRGSILARTGHDRMTVECVSWQLHEQDFEVTARQVVPWPLATPISQSKVRVRLSGIPVALLQNPLGGWFMYDGMDNSLGALPPPYSVTPYAVDVAFNQMVDPVLLLGDPVRGLLVRRRDGTPIPPQAR